MHEYTSFLSLINLYIIGNLDLELITQLTMHSTNHALISKTKSIKSYLDNGEFVAGIFIDLEIAFDTVNREILCERLSYYGFRGKINQLLKSFLANRSQYVSINEIYLRVVEIK